MVSDRNPLNDVARDLRLPAVVQPGGPRIGMASQALDVFERHALTGLPVDTQKPGKVQSLGLVASAQPDPSELTTASPVLERVKVGPLSCRSFSLVGTLDAGTALILEARESTRGRCWRGLSDSEITDVELVRT